MAKKIKPQIRMVPLLLKRQDWDSLSYKGPGSETAKKIGPSLPETRPERSGSVQGPPLPERPHHQKQQLREQKPEERRLEMGQEAGRGPRGSPGARPRSRYQSNGLFGSSLQGSAGGKAAGGRETDPAGSQSMLVPNTACLEIFRSGQCRGRAVRRGGNSRDSPPSPTGWKGR